MEAVVEVKVAAEVSPVNVDALAVRNHVDPDRDLDQDAVVLSVLPDAPDPADPNPGR